MKRRKFLGLSVLGLIGVKPLVASVKPRRLCIGTPWPRKDYFKRKHRLPKIGAPWPGSHLDTKYEFDMCMSGLRKWNCRALLR